MRPERYLKIHLIGSRTRDLPACSSALTTTLPRYTEIIERIHFWFFSEPVEHVLDTKLKLSYVNFLKIVRVDNGLMSSCH
jgi:hypothetical protein